MRPRPALIDVDTANLVWKVNGAGRLASGVLDGDWDQNRVLLENTAKHRSVFAHFVDGVPWERTELFLDALPRRLATGLAFRGTFDLRVIAVWYRAEVDPLFARMKREGFRPINPPHVLISRDGEVMLGNQGNHRVAMAKVLGIPKCPCMVVTKHALCN